ncbi:MAG TPA: ribose-phosphate pyrophosphokinase-like domain-containing protein, partial [Kofleriaceae bacterium]|nr:ribose-phosphate pyrophosphokinase-like domain-containing protein [Kofleriaceae bacterium]
MRSTYASRPALAAVLLSLFVAAVPSASAGPAARGPKKAVLRVGASSRVSIPNARKVRSQRIQTEAFPDGAFQVKVPHVAGKQVHVVVGRQKGAQAGNFYQALQTVATSQAEGAAEVHVTLASELAADAGRDGFVRAMLEAAGASRIRGAGRAPASRPASPGRRDRGAVRTGSRRVGNDTLIWGDRSHEALLGVLGTRLKVTSRVVAATARASGDSDVTLPEDPAGRHVFLLQGKPSGHESYHGVLLQTLRTAWQARQAGASGITVIAPYLPYSRSDRKDQAGIAVGASLMPRLLKAAGVDRVVFFSAHQSQEAGMYEAVGLRAVHLSGERILARHMVRRLGEGADALRVVASSQAARPQAEAMAASLAARLGVPRIRVSVKRPRKPDTSPHAYLDGLSVVAPDAGAGKRARVFANALAGELGLADPGDL